MRVLLGLLAVSLALTGCKNKFEERRAAAEANQDAGGVSAAPPTATLLTWGQNVPRDLWLDEQNLYWLNEGRRSEGEPGIFKLPKAGGTAVKLVSGKGIHAIALDEGHLYFIHPEGGSVNRVSKAGGAVEPLATEQENLAALAVDDTDVYWTSAEGIWRAPKAGGKSAEVVPKISIPSGLAVDEANVYWYSVMSGKLARAPKKGGAPKPLLSEDVTLHAFFLDQDSLYWSYGSEKKAEVKRMPKGGGKVEQVVKGEQVPSDFATDQSSVYWTSGEAIFKAAKSGGASSVVVDKTDRASDVAVDGSFVYWTDRIGRVQRAPK